MDEEELNGGDKGKISPEVAGYNEYLRQKITSSPEYMKLVESAREANDIIGLGHPEVVIDKYDLSHQDIQDFKDRKYGEDWSKYNRFFSSGDSYNRSIIEEFNNKGFKADFTFGTIDGSKRQLKPGEYANYARYYNPRALVAVNPIIDELSDDDVKLNRIESKQPNFGEPTMATADPFMKKMMTPAGSAEFSHVQGEGKPIKSKLGRTRTIKPHKFQQKW